MKLPKQLGPCIIASALSPGSLGQRYRSTYNGGPAIVETICMRSDDEVFERTLRRIETMSSIKNENLVPILTAGIDRDALYVVTPAPDVRAIELTSNSFAASHSYDVLEMVESVALGLAALHLHGALHRDIQLRHICWYDGVVKLGGFALADVLGPGSTEGVGPIGGVSTMAPSVVRGNSATTGSDIYSLGAALHQAATGIAVHPERQESLADRIARIATVPPAIDPTLRPDLKAIVAEALAADGTSTTLEQTRLISAFTGATNNKTKEIPSCQT